MSRNLRLLAERAQKQQQQQQQPPTALSDALEILRTALRGAWADKTKQEPNKKQGCLYLTNQLLHISFKLNSMQMCQGFKRNTETPSFPPEHTFPLPQQVTFSFFKGRLALLDGDYAVAQSCFEFCLSHCPRRAKHNRRLTLLFLIPVRLLSGSFPTEQLLQKHNLTNLYANLCKALKRGNLALFEHSVATHRGSFLRLGLYLLIQKSKLVAFRNLFRKTHQILDSNNHINVSDLVTAVRISSSPATSTAPSTAPGPLAPQWDESQVECVVANLIFHKVVGGYLSHQHKKLVLSKTSPFPEIGQSLFTKGM
eukprot:c10617_g1_i1.p1 GENE.c10617_g1_i1~~c10617_g1_i1.p1  ORF type:complete len:311 (-),score=71.11 c10617_g1_i1:66-998(-)